MWSLSLNQVSGISAIAPDSLDLKLWKDMLTMALI